VISKWKGGDWSVRIKGEPENDEHADIALYFYIGTDRNVDLEARKSADYVRKPSVFLYFI
jgi:hypothetical protein